MDSQVEPSCKNGDRQVPGGLVWERALLSGMTAPESSCTHPLDFTPSSSFLASTQRDLASPLTRMDAVCAGRGGGPWPCPLRAPCSPAWLPPFLSVFPSGCLSTVAQEAFADCSVVPCLLSAHTFCRVLPFPKLLRPTDTDPPHLFRHRGTCLLIPRLLRVTTPVQCARLSWSAPLQRC